MVEPPTPQTSVLDWATALLPGPVVFACELAIALSADCCAGVQTRHTPPTRLAVATDSAVPPLAVARDEPWATSPGLNESIVAVTVDLASPPCVAMPSPFATAPLPTALATTLVALPSWALPVAVATPWFSAWAIVPAKLPSPEAVAVDRAWPTVIELAWALATPFIDATALASELPPEVTESASALPPDLPVAVAWVLPARV